MLGRLRRTFSAGAPAEPDAIPVIPGYSDVRLVGTGGFSRVYTATQERFARTVAVKVITVELSGDALRRFGREQMTAGRLDGHPHVIRVYESGFTEAGQPYLTMELHERGSLADRLRREGPLPVADVLAIGVKLACALDAAHRRNVVHRDVKPQNVLVSPFVGPVLADFGIAAVDDARLGTVTGEAFSALHVAPEVLDGFPATSSADLYSLASTLYELLTGRAPYADADDEGLLGLMRRVRTGDVPPIDRDGVPPVVATELVALLQRPADDRPPSGLALAEWLRDLEERAGLPRTPLVPDGRPTVSLDDASSTPDLPPPAPIPAGATTADEPVAHTPELAPDDPESEPEPEPDAASTPRQPGGSRTTDGRDRTPNLAPDEPGPEPVALTSDRPDGPKTRDIGTVDAAQAGVALRTPGLDATVTHAGRRKDPEPAGPGSSRRRALPFAAAAVVVALVAGLVAWRVGAGGDDRRGDGGDRAKSETTVTTAADAPSTTAVPTTTAADPTTTPPDTATTIPPGMVATPEAGPGYRTACDPIEAVGLGCDLVGERSTVPVPPGAVVRQDPAPGTPLNEGDNVVVVHDDHPASGLRQVDDPDSFALELTLNEPYASQRRNEGWKGQALGNMFTEPAPGTQAVRCWEPSGAGPNTSHASGFALADIGGNASWWQPCSTPILGYAYPPGAGGDEVVYRFGNGTDVLYSNNPTNPYGQAYLDEGESSGTAAWGVWSDDIADR
jgi:serine/threonine-protein kinase PknK